MNFDKESKSWIFLGGGGGGGGGGKGGGGGRGYKHKSCHIFYTRHTGMPSSIEPYSLMKIFLTVFKKESIQFVVLTIKGR